MDQFQDQYQQIREQAKWYINPLCQFYTQLPNEIAGKIFLQISNHILEFKFNTILPYGNENTRIMALGGSTLLSVLILRKLNGKGALTLFRNAVVSYFSLGLFIAPEIYNPLIFKKRRWNRKERSEGRQKRMRNQKNMAQ